MCEEGPFLRREMHKAISLIMGGLFFCFMSFRKRDFYTDFWTKSCAFDLKSFMRALIRNVMATFELKSVPTCALY